MKNNNLLDIYQLNEFVAIDLETTGLDPHKESIIEISAIKFKNGVQDAVFSYLLNPKKTISPFIEDLTGITNEMVFDKLLFPDIIDEFISFISDIPIVGHNVGFDINFIKIHSKNEVNLEESHQICDTYFLSKVVLFSNSQFSLEALSDYYNLSTDGSHRATNDAINSGLVFLELLEQLILFDKLILERLNTLFEDRAIFNSNVIYNAYKHSVSLSKNQGKHSHDFKESIISYKSKNKNIPLNLENIIGDDGILYNNNLYKYRDAQYEMSKTIENNIHNGNISIIEAGTGLGKTYAYLIPFILEAKKKNLPFIVSTYTKNLQEQLFHKDIKNIIDLLDIDQIAIILKGRGNYICLNRLDALENNSNELINNFECHDLAAVIMWSYYTKSGDIDECGSFSIERNSRLWNLLKSDVKFCSKNCFSSSKCFYTILVNSIDEANLIVVNHSVFALDGIEKRNLLPLENYFVIDEAHDFFKATKKILTSEFDKLFFNNYLSDISSLIKSLNAKSEQINHLSNMINLTEDQVDSFFNSYLESKNLDNHKLSNYPSIKSFKDIEIEFQDCNPTLINLANNLKEMVNKIELIDETCVDFLLIKNSGLLDMLIQFSDAIRIFLKCIKSNDHISWMKYHQQSNYTSINYLLKDMGKVISMDCFGSLNIGAFCSATISVDNNFEHFKTNLGLDRLSYDRNFSEHIFQTPFFLEEQVSFYSYKSDLHINSDDYIFNISEQIFEIASFFNKKMLVLCTSYKQASQLKHRLSPKFKNINKQLLVHEKGRSRNSLIRAFKESKDSVLIGTMAFWEGVDFPGDELSILMMIRIPFSNPNDPYLKYLDDQLNVQGKNGFNEYQVPEACIKMKQGFGRLIRTELDSGIFIITDPRIFNSSYGYAIINSFPIKSTLYTNISKILTDNKIL